MYVLSRSRMYKNKLAEKVTGLTRSETLAKVASGELPANCQAVLWHKISSQEIAFAMPPPCISWGPPPHMSEIEVEELFSFCN